MAALFLGAVVAAAASSATAQTTTLSGTTTGNVSIPASSGAPLIQGDSVLTGTANFSYSGAGSVGAVGTMTSNLSGTGALWFSSPQATLVIAGTNTYTGGTSVIDTGTIEVTAGGSISHTSSDLRVEIGSFTLSGGSVGIRDAAIGSGYGVNSTLTVDSGTWIGSGGLTLAADGASGLFQLDGGSVSVSSATIGTGMHYMGQQSNGSAVVTGGTWTTTNGLAIGAGVGNGTLNLSGGAVNSGSGTIGVDLGSTSAANVSGGTWTNSGDLTVGGDGTGTLGISGTGTVIVGGTLLQGAGGTINLSSGGTLQIGNGGNSGVLANELTNDGSLIFNRTGAYDHVSVISGAGEVVKEGANTLTLSAANTYTGRTAINDGILELADADAIGPSGTLSFGGGTLRFTSSNTNDYSSRFDATGSQQFKLDTNGEDVTLSSDITGAASTLEKTGAGILTLSANNTYTGTTTVREDDLVIGGSIVGDLVVESNARGVFDQGVDTTYSGQISGAGDVLKRNSGTLTLDGANTYSGETLIEGGAIELGSGGAIGSSGAISFAGGTLRYTSANTTDYSARFSTSDGQAYKLDTNGQFVTLASDLTSANSTLEKLGAGTLTLSGSNTFALGTTLSAGTLSLSSAGALGPSDGSDPDAGPISFAGGTLGYTASNQTDYSSRFSSNAGEAFSIDTGGQTVTFATDLISSGATLAKLGLGTLALTGENDLGGGVSLAGGTLRLGSAGAIGSSSPIEFNGGTLQFTAANTTDVSGRFVDLPGQAFRIDTNGQEVTFATAITGDPGTTLVKLGSGTLTLSADNTYSGTTTVSAGTLRLGDGNSAGEVAGDIVNNASLVFDRSDSPVYTGIISGSGSVTMDGQGTLTLAGVNTYTGSTTISRGTLALGGGSALSQTSALLFAGGGLQYTSGVQTDVSGVIATSPNQPINIDTNGESVDFATGLAGTGSTLAKYGIGTLTLSGSSSYTGGTTVGGGTLDVVAGGAIDHAAGNLVVSGGTLAVSGGSATVADASIADGPGATGDLLVSAGQFDAAGTLRIGNGAGANGSLAISGGAVTTGAAIVGDQSSTGVVNVSGGSWLNTGDLDVSSGSVTISGGTVTVGGTLSEVTTGGIVLQSGGELRIGSGGAGGVLQADLLFDGSLVFDRSGSSTYGGFLSGNGSVTKEGSGTLTLSAAGGYTYSGQTTVSAGGLVVDGSLDNSVVVVSTGGSLGGAGTVSQSVTVASGGVIAPGLSGTSALLTVGSLDLQAGSEASFGIVGNGSLAGTAGVDYDSLKISGAVALATNVTVRLDFTSTTPFANGEAFQLFSFDGGNPVGHFSAVVATGVGAYAGVVFRRTGTDEWVSTFGSSEQFLRFDGSTGTLLVVPEPSTWGMLLAGSAVVAVGGLRRRHQSRRQKMLGM